MRGKGYAEFWRAKKGVLGGMWKWRIGRDSEFEKKLGYIFSSSLVLVPSDL